MGRFLPVTTAAMRSSPPLMVTKRAGLQSGGQVECNFAYRKAPEVRGDVAKIPRLKLVSFSARSRYFVQFTDEVFGSQMCVTLKHLHRFMPTDS